jgi:LPS sulfotransferase NodH
MCRFMLLSAARTGSNLLLSMLSAHNAIKTYGELFNLDTLPKQHLVQALEDPIAYLRERVYKEQRSGISAVGFKMFYDHLTDAYFRKLIDTSDASHATRERFKKFATFIDTNYGRQTLASRFRATWEFLAADRSLAVIHLKRHNLLDSLISLKAAYKTSEWWRLGAEGGKATTVQLTANECRSYFVALDGFRRQADETFALHRKLDVSYEELASDREQTLRKVFAFLNVPYQQVSTRMKKQRLTPAAESVSNYAELKECFTASPWEPFFE